MKHPLLPCLFVAMLAQAALGGEIKLELAPPEPKWVMPAMICRNSAIGLPVCLDADATTRDAIDFRPPMQGQPEGIPDPGEEQILLDIAPFVRSGDYAAVLARIRVSYDLAPLEAGDSTGVRRMRMPSAGSQSAPAGGRPRERAIDSGIVGGTRNIQPSRATSPAAGARDLQPLPDTISASLLYLIGHSYFSLQQYLPAETAFRLALTVVPGHVRAHESLGMLYLQAERYADARDHLAQAVELGRNTAHVHAALGYLEEKTRHYWSAASAFQQALVLEPDHRGARRGLLHALTETGEHAKASALVEQLLRDEPDDPGLWLYRAQIALIADEPALAVASLETALRLGDDSIENRQACAVLHMQSGNVARAAELLRGSAARGLDFALVDRALGWLADENEWDRFRELLGSLDREALGSAQRSRLLTRRASLALHDGNRRAASTGLQEALALDPSNAEALMALGRLYHGDRDYGRAELMFQRASAYAPLREDALVASAEVAIAQDNFDGALSFLSSAVLGNPARADLRRNVAILENLLLLRTER
jgi:tetratricopeptide (TPR) repeat protein